MSDSTESQTAFTQSEIAELIDGYKAIQAENAQLKLRLAQVEASIEAETDRRAKVAIEGLNQTANARAEQRAIELMAKVGQPAPADADASGTTTKPTSKASGLTRTTEYLRNRNGTNV